MNLIAEDPISYLAPNGYIESQSPAVVELAAELRAGRSDDADYAGAAFDWVRDNVAHSFDVQDSRVTVTAVDALEQRVGLCYVKAHLLVALLRAEGIPAGLCYQRLADDKIGHVVHGLIAVHLNGAWHRQDPRGNKPGVNAQFSLHQEQLAWTANKADGEVDYPIVYEAPVDSVIRALKSTDDILALYECGLPDALTEGEATIFGSVVLTR